MDVVPLSDELAQVIAKEVAAGRADNPAALIEDAVMRWVEDAQAERDDILAVAEAGAADIAAGHYTMIATRDDERRLYEEIIAALQANHSTS